MHLYLLSCRQSRQVEEPAVRLVAAKFLGHLMFDLRLSKRTPALTIFDLSKVCKKREWTFHD